MKKIKETRVNEQKTKQKRKEKTMRKKTKAGRK